MKEEKRKRTEEKGDEIETIGNPLPECPLRQRGVFGHIGTSEGEVGGSYSGHNPS